MAGVAFVGVLITVVCNLMDMRYEARSGRMRDGFPHGMGMAAVYRGISVIVLMVPTISTFCLYAAATNTRKVVLYGGYLSALEKAWNQLAGL